MRFLFPLVAILLALPMWAADGDACDSAQFANAIAQPGGPVTSNARVRSMWCVILVDDETTASGTAIYDLRDAPGGGAADQLQFLMGTNDCTAGSVSFTGSEASGAQEHDVAVDPDTGANPVISLAGTGLTKVAVNARGSHPGTFITTTWSGVTGCSTGFDALLVGVGVKQ